MYMECRHIKTNGLRCQSPALKGGEFCYYHRQVRSVPADANLPLAQRVQLPIPEDAAAIQLSIARISDAILTGRLALNKADALYAGLRIASRFIPRNSDPSPEDIAPSAEQTPAGDNLAPDSFICADEEICEGCPYEERCNPTPAIEDESEQEEEQSEEEDEESNGE